MEGGREMESMIQLLIPATLKLAPHGLKLVEYQMYQTSMSKRDQGEKL